MGRLAQTLAITVDMPSQLGTQLNSQPSERHCRFDGKLQMQDVAPTFCSEQFDKQGSRKKVDAQPRRAMPRSQSIRRRAKAQRMNQGHHKLEPTQQELLTTLAFHQQPKPTDKRSQHDCPSALSFRFLAMKYGVN